MAEITVDPKQFKQPSAPDISAVGQVHGAIGKGIGAVASKVGDYVQANRVIEEKMVLAAAKTELERDFIVYKNTPNISNVTLTEFYAQMEAKTEGFKQAAPRGSERAISAGLAEITSGYQNKALDETLQSGLKQEIGSINTSIREKQDFLVKAIDEGDFEGSASILGDILEFANALEARGATHKQVTAVRDDANALALSTEYNVKLKHAGSKEERTAIMRAMFSLPDNPVNEKAATLSYREYNRLNKVYDEAESLEPALANTVSGQSHLNLDLDQKSSDSLVKMIAQQAANARVEGQEPGVQNLAGYRALPDLTGVALDNPQRALVEGIVKSEQAARKNDPNLSELAGAHAAVGSKNSTEFPKAVSNRLRGGSGTQANEAVTALHA